MKSFKSLSAYYCNRFVELQAQMREIYSSITTKYQSTNFIEYNKLYFISELFPRQLIPFKQEIEQLQNKCISNIQWHDIERDNQIIEKHILNCEWEKLTNFFVDQWIAASFDVYYRFELELSISYFLFFHLFSSSSSKLFEIQFKSEELTNQCKDFIYCITHWILVLSQYGIVTKLNREMVEENLKERYDDGDKLSFSFSKVLVQLEKWNKQLVSKPMNQEILLEIQFCILLMKPDSKCFASLKLDTIPDQVSRRYFKKQKLEFNECSITYHYYYLLGSNYCNILTNQAIDLFRKKSQESILSLAMPTLESPNNNTTMGDIDSLRKNGFIIVKKFLPNQTIHSISNDAFRNNMLKLIHQSSLLRIQTTNQHAAAACVSMLEPKEKPINSKDMEQISKYIHESGLHSLLFQKNEEFMNQLRKLFSIDSEKEDIVIIPNESYLRCKYPNSSSVVHSDIFAYQRNQTLSRLFQEKESEDEKQECRCCLCEKEETNFNLLQCDLCIRAFHNHCLSNYQPSSSLIQFPNGDWYCPFCLKDLKVYTIWIPLQDIKTPHQGVLSILPFNHQQNNNENDGNQANGFSSSFANEINTPLFYFNDNDNWVVPYNLELGDVIIFNLKTIHAATKNNLNQARLSIDVRIAIVPKGRLLSQSIP